MIIGECRQHSECWPVLVCSVCSSTAECTDLGLTHPTLQHPPSHCRQTGPTPPPATPDTSPACCATLCTRLETRDSQIIFANKPADRHMLFTLHQRWQLHRVNCAKFSQNQIVQTDVRGLSPYINFHVANIKPQVYFVLRMLELFHVWNKLFIFQLQTAFRGNCLWTKTLLYKLPKQIRIRREKKTF